MKRWNGMHNSRRQGFRKATGGPRRSSRPNLTIARAIYRGRVEQCPGRLVMLCDRARVLARSDRPETMPR
jgi:hypothetical protein